MDSIDIFEQLLSLAMKITGNRLDVRMTICLAIKIGYFLFWFFREGDERFTGGYYAIQLVVWAIFHIYIIFIEFPYIRYGVNNEYIRKICYKVVDFLQSSILLIYFYVQVYGFNVSESFFLFSINPVLIDVSMNIDQIAKFLQGNKEQFNNTEVKEGEGLFYFALFIGCIIAFILCLISYNAVSKSSNQTFPFQPWVLILCMIGEGAFIFYIITDLISLAQGSVFGETCQKNILIFFYGLAIGMFNFYYAAILGMYVLLKFVSWIIQQYKECKKGENRVYPE